MNEIWLGYTFGDFVELTGEIRKDYDGYHSYDLFEHELFNGGSSSIYSSLKVLRLVNTVVNACFYLAVILGNNEKN